MVSKLALNPITPELRKHNFVLGYTYRKTPSETRSKAPSIQGLYQIEKVLIIMSQHQERGGFGKTALPHCNNREGRFAKTSAADG